MTRYILKRLIQLPLLILAASLIVFCILRLTGDPAALMLPPDAPPESVAKFRHEQGLDRPVPIQFLTFVGGLAQGDMGKSLRYYQPVAQLIAERLPATGQLSLMALLITIAVGVPAGVIAAVHRGKLIDTIVMFLALLGQTAPVFFVGIGLILIVGVKLRLLPTTGYGSWKHLILPSLTVASSLIALVARMTRSCMLDVLRADYIRSARAKGLPERVVLFKHALKNAFIPILTVLGLQVGRLFSGAVVTETVFAWPGIGRMAVQGIYAHDYPVVQGIVLTSVVAFILINLVVDLLYAWFDPRIHFS